MVSGSSLATHSAPQQSWSSAQQMRLSQVWPHWASRFELPGEIVPGLSANRKLLSSFLFARYSGAIARSQQRTSPTGRRRRCSVVWNKLVVARTCEQQGEESRQNRN